MSADHTKFFELLGAYARSKHHCFVAELFLKDAPVEYVSCFRPVNADKDSEDRYACRYLNIEINEAEASVSLSALTAALAQRLERELSTLGTS